MSSGEKKVINMSSMSEKKDIFMSNSISFGQSTAKKNPLQKAKTLREVKQKVSNFKFPLIQINSEKDIQFLRKKRNIMTTEERELEQIEIERKQIQKEKQVHQKI